MAALLGTPDRFPRAVPAREERRAFPTWLACALAACAGSACGGSGSSGGAGAPAAGDVVGVFEVSLPGAETFLLHGTLPLPRGTWTDVLGPDGIEPFVVLDSDGTSLVTQCEVVSRYPSTDDGVDVAQIEARVRRPEGLSAGERTSYAVTYAPHAAIPAPDPAIPAVEALRAPPFALPSIVALLLADPEALRVEALDVFGNGYVARPLSGDGTSTLLHHGPVEVEVKVAQTLRPEPVVEGPEGTLPHHLGVHAYVSASASSSIVHLDLRLHNGHSGLDPNDPDDDPLGKVYFQEILLRVPAGWAVVQDFVDPFLDEPEGAQPAPAYPLVRANDDGTMHVMFWQGQFHRRLALAPVDLASQAQEEIRGAGLGFARRGVNAAGKELWSWWNADTARWFPQAQPLPSLEHVGAQAIAAKLAQDVAAIQTYLELGTSAGGYPVPDEVLGWAHPYGVPYGGMAGGSEINLVDGVAALEAGAPDGFRLARIVHRMHTDRMPNVLFDADGTPTDVEDWVVPVDGVNDFVPFFHYILPTLDEHDPFGVYAAPTFQVEAVEAAGLEPAYEEALAGYAPHDYQHLVRYTRSAKVLAWLDDDALAQDDLAMQAANFHLSYHRYANSPGFLVQSTGFKADRTYVDEHGPSGFTFGRGEGWALDCAVAAYATGSPEWRAAQLPWLDDVCDLVVDGQGQCNGFIQANVSEKFLDGKYRARQLIEQSIVENALLGMLESVYQGADENRTAELKDALRRSLYAMISPMAWSPGQQAPWAFTAVGPLDELEPVWCKASEMPADGHSTWTDAFQNWSSFAYGFRLTKDPKFLQFAELQLGGDLLGTLLEAGLDNLENRAPLLALAQELYGTP